jgi:hypothetical protein
VTSRGTNFIPSFIGDLYNVEKPLAMANTRLRIPEITVITKVDM